MTQSKIDPYIFRTYDIRGRYPDELNEEVTYRIGLAYTNLFPDLKRIVVGFDARGTSRSLANSLTKGLIDGGVGEVVDIGMTPVPLMYFAVCHYPYDGGITITGSHNPKVWNGVKMQTRDAYPVITQDLQKIKDMVISNNLTKVERPQGKIIQKDITNDYIDYLTSKIQINKPLKIIIDSGNGSVNFIPEKIFKKLGCDVTTVYGEPDPDFPHHLPDPYEEENLQDLKTRILQEKADLGFGYDGDGDRLGIVLSNGRIVKGGEYLFMFAQDALAKKHGSIAIEVRTPVAFLEEMEKLGAETYFCVGHHKAILDKIKQENCVFGGETTGHMFFPLEYYLVDDAIFASLKFAQLASPKQDLVNYVEKLPKYFASVEVFIATPDEIKEQLIQKLQNYLRQNNYNFIDVDGARIIFDNGWALARMANTSEFIKCRFEGKTQEALIRIEKEALEIFKKVGVPVKEEHYQELGL